MESNLLTKILLLCIMFVLFAKSVPRNEDPEHCVNKRFCNYELIKKSPLSFNIDCHSADYKQVQEMFNCFKSCKKHTISKAKLVFPVSTLVDSHLLDGLKIEDLTISNVSNSDTLAFDKITELKTLQVENGNLTEIPLSIRSLKHLTSLLLMNQKLEIIPDFTFQQTKSLRLLVIDSNLLSKIGKNAFTGLDKIVNVRLLNNKLTSEAIGAFRNLPDVMYLHLRNNQIRELTSHAFGNKTRLYFLDLSNNPISSIHNEAFAGVRLHALNIAATNLTSVPTHAFKHLNALDDLIINHNPIAELKANSFQGLTALRKLVVGSKNLSFVHEDAFAGLENLSWLSIQDTNLTSIPARVLNKVPNLIHLSIQRNDLVTEWKPAELGNLTHLGYLDLSESRFSLTPDAFAGLDRLIELELRNLSLTKVPSKAIRNLSQLTLLDLKENKITKLKRNAFLGLNRLQWLWLEDNQISTVAANAFSGLEKNLLSLYLKNNNLTRIPTQALQNMKNLGQVSFGNFIEYVEADAFKTFGESITSIDLSGNRIKSFAKTAFYHLPSLTVLHLQNNQIHHLDFAVFQPIVNQLGNLYANDNPLVCSFESYWFYKVYQKNICNNAFDYQYKCILKNDVCQHTGTNEKECKKKWKPVMCNASSVYGCVGEEFCKGEAGCVFSKPFNYFDM